MMISKLIHSRIKGLACSSLDAIASKFIGTCPTQRDGKLRMASVKVRAGRTYLGIRPWLARGGTGLPHKRECNYLCD